MGEREPLRCEAVCRGTRETCWHPEDGPHRCLLPKGHSGKHSYQHNTKRLLAEAR